MAPVSKLAGEALHVSTTAINRSRCKSTLLSPMCVVPVPEFVQVHTRLVKHISFKIQIQAVLRNFKVI